MVFIMVFIAPTDILPHNSLSIVPLLSPFISQPFDLNNSPSLSSPHPTPEEALLPSEHISEDVSYINDSEPEDDLSPILNALIVSSIKFTLASIANLTFVSDQTIPIPQDLTEACELMHQAIAKHQSALHKLELVGAAL